MFVKVFRTSKMSHRVRCGNVIVWPAATRDQYYYTSCYLYAKHKALRLVLADLPKAKKIKSQPAHAKDIKSNERTASADRMMYYDALAEQSSSAPVEQAFEAGQLWFSDPIIALQAYLNGPLLDEEREHTFQPSEQSMREATKCFVGDGRNHTIQFAGKALEEAQYPTDELPEVAFIGRSNVGKSSVVSALFMYDQVKVPVSSRPGKTRKLNFYRAGSCFTLVDLPGYGQNMPVYFHQLIYDFLKTRKNLRRTFVLIDCAVAAGAPAADFPSPNDTAALQLLSQFGESCCIVLTKIDACSPSQRIRALQNFQRLISSTDGRQIGTCFTQPFMVSAVTGEGMGVLQSFITYVTGNLAYVDRRS